MPLASFNHFCMKPGTLLLDLSPLPGVRVIRYLDPFISASPVLLFCTGSNKVGLDFVDKPVDLEGTYPGSWFQTTYLASS